MCPALARSNPALRLVSKLPLDLDVRAFLIDCGARNLSPNTLRIYRVNLLAFQQWLDVKDAATVTSDYVRRFLLYLQETRNAGGTHQAYRVLKTFFRWLVAEDVIGASPVARVGAPRVPQEALEPANLDHLWAMAGTCERGTFTGDRDRSVLLCLLDSGCRASEFVALNCDDVDLGTGAVRIRHGKGGKARTAFLGVKARKELVRYLRHRPDTSGPLWVSHSGERLHYSGLREIVRRRARLAGVPAPSLHSFRRSFALLSLRGGMNVYALQKIMGHADLSVLRRYLAQTEQDLAAAHQAAGPVDHLLR